MHNFEKWEKVPLLFVLVVLVVLVELFPPSGFSFPPSPSGFSFPPSPSGFSLPPSPSGLALCGLSEVCWPSPLGETSSSVRRLKKVDY